MPIDVILADKNPLVIRGLKQIIGRDTRFRLAATVPDGRRFLAEVRKRRFDVAVIGWEMPGADGRAVLQALRGQENAPPVIVYTGAVDASVSRQVMALGGAGFVSKSELPEVLINTLAEVAAGRMVFPFVDVRLLYRTPADVLTPREQEILAALASGASNRALADQLEISPHTVKFHLKNVYAKLDVSSRAQAVSVFLSAFDRKR
jgi:two-component system nitrate/nitrite response regulator NarP